MENLQTITEFPDPLRGAEDKVTSLTSLPTGMPEVLPDIDPDQNKDLNHLRATEPENIGGNDKGEVEGVRCYRLDDDDDEDYDEVVVNLTPLNEVTSVTDRTSPWTSVLSDPDLASLESAEPAEDLVDLNLESFGGGSKRESVGEEDGNSLVGSGGDASDVDSEEDVTLRDVPRELSEEEEEQQQEEDEEEEGPRATMKHAAGSQDSPQQAYPFSLLPNTSASYSCALNSRLQSKIQNRSNQCVPAGMLSRCRSCTIIQHQTVNFSTLRIEGYCFEGPLQRCIHFCFLVVFYTQLNVSADCHDCFVLVARHRRHSHTPFICFNI